MSQDQMDDLMQPTDDDFNVDYEVWVNDEWMAGAGDLDTALGYALQYLEEGEVEVVKVTREVMTVMNARLIL